MYPLKIRRDLPEVTSNDAPKLDIHVIFTKIPGAPKTLNAARDLARDLGARITILLAQVVPYPLPLDRPPVPTEFTEQSLLSMACDQEVETIVKTYLCRDQRQTIRQVLSPESVVLVGERRLAAVLKRDGHHVILV